MATLTLGHSHSHHWAKSLAVMISLIGQARRRSEVDSGRNLNAGKVCIGILLIACMIRWDGAIHGLEAHLGFLGLLDTCSSLIELHDCFFALLIIRSTFLELC